MTNKILERIGKNLIKFWYLGFSFYMFVNAVVGMLAIIGLATWQRSQPHSLDSTWMNFNFYWNILGAFQYMQFVVLSIGIYFMIKTITKKKVDEVKK